MSTSIRCNTQRSVTAAPVARRVSSPIFQPATGVPAASSAPAKFACRAAASTAEGKKTWNPINNKYFETFSYLQPLTDSQIKGQIDYLLRNNYIPCIEFAESDQSYTKPPPQLDSSIMSGTFQNTYWPMWKLPMFGTKDSQDVMDEIKNCAAAYDECYIRVVGFDNIAQVQCVSFLVHRPPAAVEYASLDDRRRG